MRFSIRDLLWLMVVVALGVAWWVDRIRLTKLNSELQIAVEAQTAAKVWTLGAAKIQRDRAESLQRQLDELRIGTAPLNPSAPAPNLPSE